MAIIGIGLSVGLYVVTGVATSTAATLGGAGSNAPEIQSGGEWPAPGCVVSTGVSDDKTHVPLMPFPDDYTTIEDQGLTRVILSDGVFTDGVISNGAAVVVDISLEVDNSLQVANDNYSQKVDVPIFFSDWKNTKGATHYESIKGSLYSGADFGRLTIPRINLKDKIVRYGAQPQIDIGLCQYASWDLPGGQGINLLAAHNFNPDWKIGNLKVGDHIYYSTVYGNFEYEVYSATINYDGRDTYWLRDSYYAAKPTDMVLMTCYPFDSDGKDGVRYLVFARQVGGPTLNGEPITDIEQYSDFYEFESIVHNKE